MLLLLAYLCLAILISFLCSIMESVLLSTPMSFLVVKKKEGHKSAPVFIKLKNQVEKPLAAILSLNTIAHTIGAAGVGAEATRIYGEVYFGIISAILTFLILIFSEIIPKTIGATYWRRLALTSGLIMNFMVIICYPLVIMSVYLTKMFSKNSKDISVSREEISVMADIGTKEGIFKESENMILQNLIKLKAVKVTEIMTPRVVVVAADENMVLEDFLANKDFLYYSRIPIYVDNIENITGYVFRQTVFEKLAEQKKNLKLKDISRKIVIVPEFQTLLKLWETLLKKKEHIALVIDEYGGMDGIVTMEDVIESILGVEILDERDKIIDMQQYAKERWAKRKAKFDILNSLDELNS